MKRPNRSLRWILFLFFVVWADVVVVGAVVVVVSAVVVVRAVVVVTAVVVVDMSVLHKLVLQQVVSLVSGKLRNGRLCSPAAASHMLEDAQPVT